MDAVEFIRASDRMCAYYDSCSGCPLEFYDTCLRGTEESVPLVEEWAAEHPEEAK